MQHDVQEIFDLLTELWNTGKTDLTAQVYSEQAVRNDPNQVQPARGVQQIANYVAEVRKGFPDFKLEIKQRINEEDLVATQWTCSGTHDGDFQGIPPTRRRVEMAGVTIHRIAGNKIVEERSYFDRLELFRQLGVAPGAAQSEAKSAAHR
jgi:steroid delta-isomerase-like uncharacterized protein